MIRTAHKRRVVCPRRRLLLRLHFTEQSHLWHTAREAFDVLDACRLANPNACSNGAVAPSHPRTPGRCRMALSHHDASTTHPRLRHMAHHLLQPHARRHTLGVAYQRGNARGYRHLAHHDVVAAQSARWHGARPVRRSLLARLSLTPAIALQTLLITARLPISQALAMPLNARGGDGRPLVLAIAWCALTVVTLDAVWVVAQLIHTIA